MDAACSPPLVLTQKLENNQASAEVRAVTHACLLGDVPRQSVRLAALAGWEPLLREGALPVGSVEFVQRALCLLGQAEPDSVSYPPRLAQYLGRRITSSTLGAVLRAEERVFLKPTRTKLFTGFVWDPNSLGGDSDPSALSRALTLPPDTPVWTARPEVFVSEWRYYAVGAKLIGEARYDPDGPDDAPAPDLRLVRAAVEELGSELAGFALDFAVTADNRTILVEANDGWALGLYGRSVSPPAYLRLLAQRWRQLVGG